MKEIIKNNQYVEVCFIPEMQLGRIVWKSKIIPSEEYRDAFLVLIDFAEKFKGTEKQVENFLSDTTIQGVVSPADRKWFQKIALPAAIATGLAKATVVISGSVFKKYYINLILKAVKTFELPFKVFNNYNEAIEWLKSE